MIHEKSHSKTSIQQLYENRKAQYKMPESIMTSLPANTRHKSRRQYWRYVTPFALASVLAVILIWPNKKELYVPQMAFESAMQTADNSERESIAPSPSPAPSSSLVRSQINEISTPMAQISEQRKALEEKSIEDAVAGTLVVNEALGSEDIVAVTENSFKLATPVLQPAAIPVENSDVAAVSPTQSNKGAEKLLSGLEGRDSYDSLPEIAESATVSEVDIIAADAMNYSQNNIIVSEEPEKQTNVARSILAMSEVPSRQIADNETAEILKLNVIDGEQGLFETCEGEPVELPVKTELKGWVRISIDSENIHTVEALDVIECHADK